MENILSKFILTFAVTAIIMSSSTCFSKDDIIKESVDSAGITQRVIKIHGTIDKPRTIFIVPRARLVNTEKGSIEKYALQPIFPDSSIAGHVK